MTLLYCRPLIAADLSDNLLTVFLLNILSVPALIHCIRTMSPDVCFWVIA